MRLFNMIAVLVAVCALSGCAVLENPYSCGYYGCNQQQREQGSVAAIKRHGQAVHAVNDPGLIPLGSNCDRKEYGVVYAGSNSGYDVDSYGGQTCRGGPISRAGVQVQEGPGDVSFEDCKKINFSILECQVYLQKRPGGGQ